MSNFSRADQSVSISVKNFETFDKTVETTDLLLLAMSVEDWNEFLKCYSFFSCK